jgi:hypothetical protein
MPNTGQMRGDAGVNSAARQGGRGSGMRPGGERYRQQPGSRQFNSEDLIKFRDIRELLYKENLIDDNYLKARDDIIKYFELRMRDSIAGCLNILYGNEWISKKYLPKHVRENGISRALSSKEKFEPDYIKSDNLLTYSDQTHLLDIILVNWTNCFHNIFHGHHAKSDDKKAELKSEWKKIYRKRKDVAHYDKSLGRYVMEIFNNCVRILQWMNKSIEIILSPDIGEIVEKNDLINLYFRDKKTCNEQIITKEEISSIWKKIKDKDELNIKFRHIPPLYREDGRKKLAIYKYLILKKQLIIEYINVNEVTFKLK